MPTTWAIEETVFTDDDVSALTHQVERQGHTLRTFRSLDELALDDARLIPRCSVGVAIELAARPVPARPLCDVAPFDVRAFAPALGDDWLNAPAHRFVPLGELVARKAELFAELGDDERLFLRPPECDKRFDGDISYAKYFEPDVRNIADLGCTPDQLVLVARPVDLLDEWRMVIVEQEAIAGSNYKAHVTSRRPEFALPPDEAFDYADAIAERLPHLPDVWVLDIARLAGDVLRVVELGPFACADLYGSDLEAVVEAVTDVI